MGRKSILKTRKFMIRIFFLIATVLFLTISIFSVTIYYNVEKTIFNNENQQNQKIMNLVKFSIDNMNEMVKNLCNSYFFNKGIEPIMYNKNEDIRQLIYEMNNLKTSFVDTSTFIHSIFIYNNINKEYYSTYKGMFFRDLELEKLIKSYASLPVLKPSIRKIASSESSDPKEYYDVLTYFMYDSLDRNNNMDGGLIINVKADWLFNNLKIIGMVDNKDEDKMIIMEQTGKIISSNPIEDTFKTALKDAYKKEVLNSKEGQKDNGFFVSEIEKKNYIISYISVKSADWILFKVQPYNRVYEYINKLKTTIAFIAFIFFMLAIAAAVYVSGRIYKPIGNLIKNISIEEHQKLKIEDSKDEFSYLDKIYKSTISQLDIFKKDMRSNSQIFKNYFLRNLIVDSSSISKDDFIKAKGEYNVCLTLEDSFSVCIVRIDNYKKYEQGLSIQDKELNMFIITNIASEILSEKFKNEIIQIKNDQLTIIINVQEGTTDYFETMTELIKQIQGYVEKYYKLSVSAAISNISENIQDITLLCNEASINSEYRYIYGEKSVIISKMVAQNIKNEKFEYCHDLEKRLMREIKSGNMNYIDSTLTEIQKEVSKLSYNSILLYVLNFINTLQNTVDEVNQIRVKPINIDLIQLSHDVRYLETLNEAFGKIKETVVIIISDDKNWVNDKKDIIVEAVIDIINTNYTNVVLSITEIASGLKVSSVYIGKIFKEKSGMSIPEYISEVRMKKAAEWLLNSKLSINEIMVKVGIENESYFYKLFKRKYSTTPREYVISNALNGYK
ncbi:MAG TPA: AraC family transcriptional regulator [Ruminiclostridium sp.]